MPWLSSEISSELSVLGCKISVRSAPTISVAAHGFLFFFQSPAFLLGHDEHASITAIRISSAMIGSEELERGLLFHSKILPIKQERQDDERGSGQEKQPHPSDCPFPFPFPLPFPFQIPLIPLACLSYTEHACMGVLRNGWGQALIIAVILQSICTKASKTMSGTIEWCCSLCNYRVTVQKQPKFCSECGGRQEGEKEGGGTQPGDASASVKSIEEETSFSGSAQDEQFVVVSFVMAI